MTNLKQVTFALFLALIATSVTFTVSAQDAAATTKAAIKSSFNDTPLPRVALQSKTVYADLGGNGSNISFNYDQILLKTPKMMVAASLGLGTSMSAFSGDVDPIVPVEAKLLFGNKNHHLETGIGVMTAFGFDETSYSLKTVFENEAPEPTADPDVRDTVNPHSGGTSTTTVWQYTPEKEYTSLYATARLGYRYQNPAGGIFFRAGVTPMAKVYGKEGLTAPTVGGSVSLGWTFKHKPTAVFYSVR